MTTTLVLLPGLDGTDNFFQPLLAALPAHVQPLVITYPDHGPQDYESLLSLVRARLLGVNNCIVLGWSFSGPLALRLARAEPDKVRGVILAASFVRAPNRLLEVFGGLLAGPLVWFWRAGRRLPLLLRPRSDALREAKMRTWRQVGAHVLAQRLRVILKVDARADLQACTLPLLYIASEEDGVVPQRNAQEIRCLHAAAHVVRIPGHHQSLYTHAQQAARVIMDFWVGCETRR